MPVIQDPVTGLLHDTDDPFAQQGLPTTGEYLPQFNAAQIDTGALPQLPHGYDPSMLAMAMARSDENVAGAGQQQMSQLRRTLGQQGLTNSPMAAAYQGQLAGQIGNQQVAGKRDIEISNMAEANRMALEQSKMLFSAMSQNAGFQQTGREAEFGAKVGNQRQNSQNLENARMQANQLEWNPGVVTPGGGPPQRSITGDTIAGITGGDIANAQPLGSNG